MAQFLKAYVNPQVTHEGGAQVASLRAWWRDWCCGAACRTGDLSWIPDRYRV